VAAAGTVQPLAVHHRRDFLRQVVHQERFGDQRDVRVEPAMVDDDVARIAGRIQDFRLRPPVDACSLCRTSC
jgi:hypothetical protein